MKNKETSKKPEKPVAKVNVQELEKNQAGKATDSLAVNEKDTTKVRAVDGNATA